MSYGDVWAAHHVKWGLVCYHGRWTEWVTRWNRWLRQFIRGCNGGIVCAAASAVSEWWFAPGWCWFCAGLLVKKRNEWLCDKVPVGVFVYAEQERKWNVNITGSYVGRMKVEFRRTVIARASLAKVIWTKEQVQLQRALILICLLSQLMLTNLIYVVYMWKQDRKCADRMCPPADWVISPSSHPCRTMVVLSLFCSFVVVLTFLSKIL